MTCLPLILLAILGLGGANFQSNARGSESWILTRSGRAIISKPDYCLSAYGLYNCLTGCISDASGDACIDCTSGWYLDAARKNCSLRAPLKECNSSTIFPSDRYMCCDGFNRSVPFYYRKSDIMCCGIGMINRKTDICCGDIPFSSKDYLLGTRRICNGTRTEPRPVAYPSEMYCPTSDTFFNASSHLCCEGGIVEKENMFTICSGDGTDTHDVRYKVYCGGALHDQGKTYADLISCCNKETVYKVSEQTCCAGELEDKSTGRLCCSQTTWFDPATHACCPDGFVYPGAASSCQTPTEGRPFPFHYVAK